MAAAEIYDYISAGSADNNETLTLEARGAVREVITRRQVMHKTYGGTTKVVDLSGGEWDVWLEVEYSNLTASDAGTVLDFFMNAGKGNGFAETFKFTHADGHTYVVRFDTDVGQVFKLGGIRGYDMVRFKVEGKV